MKMSRLVSYLKRASLARRPLLSRAVPCLGLLGLFLIAVPHTAGMHMVSLGDAQLLRDELRAFSEKIRQATDPQTRAQHLDALEARALEAFSDRLEWSERMMLHSAQLHSEHGPQTRHTNWRGRLPSPPRYPSMSGSSRSTTSRTTLARSIRSRRKGRTPTT